MTSWSYPSEPRARQHRGGRPGSARELFIDELDAIGRTRGTGAQLGGHDEREQTLNQILTEMGGFDSREGVIVLAATNRADVLDQALLRPGRFDRRVVVQRPDRAGRAAILKVHTKSAGASAKHSSESDGPGAHRLPRGGTRAARAVGASQRPGASGFDRATRHSVRRDMSTPRRRFGRVCGRASPARWVAARPSSFAAPQDDGLPPVFQHQPYSEATAELIDAEVRRIVEESQCEADRRLAEHRDKLDALAHALLNAEIAQRERNPGRRRSGRTSKQEDAEETITPTGTDQGVESWETQGDTCLVTTRGKVRGETTKDPGKDRSHERSGSGSS